MRRTRSQPRRSSSEATQAPCSASQASIGTETGRGTRTQKQAAPRDPSLPSWCQHLRKEDCSYATSTGSSGVSHPSRSYQQSASYLERITTSTVTTEIRLRQESVRCWNKRLEEASARAFERLVGPVCGYIRLQTALDTGTGSSSSSSGGSNGSLNNASNANTADSNHVDETENDGDGDGDGDDWDQCQQFFGMPTPTVSAGAACTNPQTTKEDPLPGSLLVRYPPEVLPVVVVSSPLVSNCLRDRLGMSRAMWSQLNSLPGIAEEIDHLRNDETICLYLPRLLSSWNETLGVLWESLLHHFENTHDAPERDPDDPSYCANPLSLAARRHSYHFSKKGHYQRIAETGGGVSSFALGNHHRRPGKTPGWTTGAHTTKKQRSLQDVLLEFLTHVFEEPGEFMRPSETETESANGHKGRSRRGSYRGLVVLLEDPRIVHPRATPSRSGGSAGSGLPGANASAAHAAVPPHSHLQQAQLLETLAAWRSLHGIPVSLVVLDAGGSSSPGRQARGSSNSHNNPLLNPSVGRFGARTLRCSVPGGVPVHCQRVEAPLPPAATAYALWTHYFLRELADAPMPLLAPMAADADGDSDSLGGSSFPGAPSSTEGILELCSETLRHESSCSSWTEALRARITTKFYTRRGSFVWDALHPRTALEADPEKARGYGNGERDSPSGLPHGSVSRSGEEGAPGVWRGVDRPKGAGARASGTDASSPKEQLQLQPFEAGTDAIHLFYPELVAWFCSYPKAHKLLSANAGADKAGMNLSDKCEGLLECSGLLDPRSDAKGEQSATVSPSTGRRLRFWWSVSCSLLPLRILALTTAGRGGGTAVGQRCDVLCGPWVLARLAEVYRRLVLEESQGDLAEPEPGDGGFAGAILRRYLQRGGLAGGEKDSTGGGDESGHRVSSRDRAVVRLLTTMVRQLVILVDARDSESKRGDDKEDRRRGESHEIDRGVEEAILEMNRLALGQVEAWTRRWIERNPLMAAESAASSFGTELSISKPANFRRRILDNLPRGARELYQAMEGSLSIERDDWFRSFDGTTEDFAVGVWTLQKCGLVRPRTKTVAATVMASTVQKAGAKKRGGTKRRREVVSYEKVAVVWC